MSPQFDFVALVSFLRVLSCGLNSSPCRTTQGHTQNRLEPFKIRLHVSQAQVCRPVLAKNSSFSWKQQIYLISEYLFSIPTTPSVNTPFLVTRDSSFRLYFTPKPFVSITTWCRPKESPRKPPGFCKTAHAERFSCWDAEVAQKTLQHNSDVTRTNLNRHNNNKKPGGFTITAVLQPVALQINIPWLGMNWLGGSSRSFPTQTTLCSAPSISSAFRCTLSYAPLGFCTCFSIFRGW